MIKNLSILAGIVVVAGAVIFLTLKKTVDKVETGLSTEATEILLSVIRDNVQVTDGDNKYLAKTEEKINEGSLISTSETGRALIEGDGKTVTLDHNSEMTIAVSNSEKTLMKVHSGNAWARVKKTLEAGEFFEMETDNAVAVVRGTAFGVITTPENTIILVVEGIVQIIPIDPDTGFRNYQKAVFVNKGEKATISKNGEVIVSKISTDDMKNPWYIYNNEEVLPFEPTVIIKPSIITEKIKQSSDTEEEKASTSPSAPIETNKIEISSIYPTAVNKCFSGETIIDMRGQGFFKIKSLFVGNKVTSDYTLKSDNQIKFNVHQFELKNGSYDIGLIDLNNNIIVFPVKLLIECDEDQLENLPEENQSQEQDFYQ